MSEAKEPAKPIVDVAKPGKTAPPLTSKPVLVTNRAMLKDPMMVPDKAQDDDEETKKPEVSPSKPDQKVQTIAEIAAEANAKKTAEAAEVEEKKLESKEPPKPEPAAKEASKPDEKAPEEKPAEKEEESADDDQSDGDDKDPNLTDAQIEAASEAEVAHDTNIQKLIESKKYFVPINAVEERRAKRIIILGAIISIVLALAWVDVALDAGLIQIGSVKPVTHFFSN